MYARCIKWRLNSSLSDIRIKKQIHLECVSHHQWILKMPPCSLVPATGPLKHIKLLSRDSGIVFSPLPCSTNGRSRIGKLRDGLAAPMIAMDWPSQHRASALLKDSYWSARGWESQERGGNHNKERTLADSLDQRFSFIFVTQPGSTNYFAPLKL